jgi:hypothetical protein
MLMRMQQEEFQVCMAIVFMRATEEYRDLYPVDNMDYRTPGTPEYADTWLEVICRCVRFLSMEGGMHFENLVMLGDEHGNLGDRGREINYRMAIYETALAQEVLPLAFEVHLQQMLLMIEDGRVSLEPGPFRDCLNNLLKHIDEVDKKIPQHVKDTQFESRAGLLRALGIEVLPGQSGIPAHLLLAPRMKGVTN